jgi:hypothetical protein
MKKLFIILSLLISGCATIISGTTSDVFIDSLPLNSSFNVINQAGIVVHRGFTPEKITLKTSSGFFSGERYIVNYYNADYYGDFSVIDYKINNWYFGNLIWGGFFGMLIVDPLTGAMWTLDKESSTILEKK